MVWTCTVCGFEYNEAEGYADDKIVAGTKFEAIPADWVCPVCGVYKTNFEKA